MTDETFDKLLHQLLDGTLNEEERAGLNAALLASPERRRQYLQTSALHATLTRYASAGEMIPAFAQPQRPTKSSDVPDTVQSQRQRPRRIMMALIAGIGVAAAVCLSVILTAEKPLAVVVESGDVQWMDGSPVVTEGAVPVGQSLELQRGFLRLRYPTGATATLEAPCRFLVKEAESLTMIHGRVSVHAPEGAQGFRVDTPGGRFVDLGTEFGLAVGTDGNKPVVLTEVFNGEVEVQATATPTRLGMGESRALVQETDEPTLLTVLDESPIMLVNHARNLPVVSANVVEQNLALGKPVFSPGFYARKHGSVFPPDRLTDGRLNDSGVPGDWSFWLAPNEQHGEFTVDLLQPETVGRVSLQNTNNRGIADRGVKAFTVYGSVDNVSFTPLTSGELPRIHSRDGNTFPFQDFTFAPVETRYVKVVVTEHYRHRTRPATRTDHGGGLNEIRIFSK